MKSIKNKINYTTGKQKIIYVFRINDDAHKDLLKIGDTYNNLVNFVGHEENTLELENQARARIDEYTKTAGVKYDLLYTTVAIDKEGNAFRDYDVHRLLANSGIKSEELRGSKEWFKIDLNTAKNAIKATKEKRVSLSRTEITKNVSPITFRDEQKEAIELAIKRFKSKDTKEMLWNAKMRFGKTLSALEVIRRMKYERAIIITHRPVVDDGWFEDFKKIFATSDNYQYGSKNNNVSIDNLIKDKKNKGINFVYFASIQDLRGSKEVGGKFEKNETLYDVDWDLVIIDEAHEGTTTKLGENVIEKFKKNKTRFLYLSGTPFNIQDKFEDENVYTWDYTMEQRAKEEWETKHPLESNPYDDLPKINIFTYDLSDDLKNYFDISDKAFNFKEFFRVYTGDIETDRCEIPNGCEKGDFIHKADVIKFLDLMTKEDEESNYPFSKKYYRENFCHTLWIIPGVKEAKALSKLLKEHKIFGKFTIVNVAGEGDEDETRDDALDKVKKAIKQYDYTITLSCGKLTTGTTIKEWTAVMYLAGSYLTSASSYLQTIFRVQTPCKSEGKIKDNCYVFDFAPDRVLRILAEASSMNIRQSNDKEKRLLLKLLINYLPVISMKGSSTKEYDVDNLLRELKSAYAERVARNGFDDNKLYNDELLKLDDLEIKKFNELREIIGKQTSDKPKNKITINEQGLDNTEIESIEEMQKDVKKKERELTPEEKERLQKYLEAKKQKDTAISILRGISVRIPLLIYGMDKGFNEEISIDNFTNLVDDESFEEFMPKGVTKKKFNEFKKYYDKDVFVEAGKLIRLKLKNCDSLPVLERILEISSIFKTFRNPDKETVLTPWKTVNMHISDTLGGYYLYKENVDDGKDFEPKLINNGDVTKNTLLNVDAKILEINSKTGLYPLYVAYSIYRTKLDKLDKKKIKKETIDDLWYKTIEDNIYVLCKTKMAKTITLRTLCGYNMSKNGVNYTIKGGYKPNIHYFEDYVNQVKNKQDKIVEKVLNPKYWGKDGKENMKFDAVVGNPPYQITDGGGTGDSALPVYNKYVQFSKVLDGKYISLIMPSRWMKGGKGLDEFRDEMINDTNIKKLFDYDNAEICFPNVHIDGGVCYFLIDKKYNGKCEYIYCSNGEKTESKRYLKNDIVDTVIRDSRTITIIEKTNKISEKKFSEIVSSRNPYGYYADLFNCPEKYKELGLIYKEKDNYIKIYGVEGKKGGAKRVIGYIKKNSISKNDTALKKYNLFFSKAYSTDATIPPEIISAKPNEVCTETFLQIGPFNSASEQKNCLKYIKTKFFRALLYYNRSGMNNTKKNFDLIPLFDFSSTSKIPWEKALTEIDKYFYKKSDLSQTEIEYIENNIKAME